MPPPAGMPPMPPPAGMPPQNPTEAPPQQEENVRLQTTAGALARDGLLCGRKTAGRNVPQCPSFFPLCAPSDVALGSTAAH